MRKIHIYIQMKTDFCENYSIVKFCCPKRKRISNLEEEKIKLDILNLYT